MSQPADIAINFSQINFDSLNEILFLTTLPAKLKRRYLGRLARMVVKNSNENIKTQKTVDGVPFHPRKMPQGQYKLRKKRDGSVKRVKTRPEMLWLLARKKNLSVWHEDDDTVTIKYRKDGVGRVAAKHQYGGKALGLSRKAPNYPFFLDPTKVGNLKPMRVNGEPGCTISQAAMLYRLGFVYRGRRPDYRWIRENITRAKAAAIVEALLKKVSWSNIPDGTPARPFLGARPEQIRAMGDTVMENLYVDLMPRRLAAKFKFKYNN